MYKYANAYIFHGTGGHPKENWFEWIRLELEKNHITSVVPQFPAPDPKTYSDWESVMMPYLQSINTESLLIGHSLGGLFLIRLLEQTDIKVKTAVIVAAPAGIEPLPNSKTDTVFSGWEFDWETIRTKANNFIVLQSENDPYVPYGNGILIAQKLGVKLTKIKDAGHFNEAAGYTKFPELLELLQ